jgi:FdhD protein
MGFAPKRQFGDHDVATGGAAFLQIHPGGATFAIMRLIAEEVPIAIEVNGIGYAVLMATPADLVDFAYGFAHAERLIDRASDIIDTDSFETPDGILLRITLAPPLASRIEARVRHRVAESSCGLCGIENLEQALRPLPSIRSSTHASSAAIFTALAALRDYQPLNSATGAVHGAAAAAADGAIRIVREDVGRHNAFDKLIGAMLRADMAWENGFALLSSRCSYELVEKAVLADCPMLVTISAPTRLAVTRAAAAGLPLRVLARADAMLATVTTPQP